MTSEIESPTASPKQQKYPALHKATLELLYFKAISLYRRRSYEKCIEVCNAVLQTGHENNVQMFAAHPDREDGDDGRDEWGRIAAGGGFGGGPNAGGSYGAHSSSSGIGGGGGGGRYGSNLQRGIAARNRQHQQQGRLHNNNKSSGAGGDGNKNNRQPGPLVPTWMMEGIWQLKMRALTQRIYIDDLETNDDGSAENEEVEFERIATAARPGTSIKTAFVPRPSTSALRQRTARTSSGPGGEPLKSALGPTRPTSGMARPGTGLSRPGSSSVGGRPASRCGTASRVRATSAAAFTVGDATAPLYQASRLNPTIYAERHVLVKALFEFLYYHESDVPKAYSLCGAVLEVARQKAAKKRTPSSSFVGRPGTAASAASLVDWWWDQQMGRCLLAMRHPRKAEAYLQQSLAAFAHPDTYLLLSRLYQRLEQPQRALELINSAVERHPFDVTFRVEQGRLFEAMSKPDDAVQMYRLVVKLNPINVEALACIAVSYFYDNNPELALMYYRRILGLGVHTAEIYCNIALCCLYGGQIDLVMPCFQRSLSMAKTSEQRADIWYNLSFVAITTGDFNLARRCLQLCLTADANNGAALNNLAVLAAHAGDLPKAKSYLSAAKEVLRDSYEIESNLAYMEQHYKL